jgi:hypothetical protein
MPCTWQICTDVANEPDRRRIITTYLPRHMTEYSYGQLNSHRRENLKCYEFTQKSFKVTVKTQQCINISILLWQNISGFLDHLQAGIQRYEVQSVHISA